MVFSALSATLMFVVPNVVPNVVAWRTNGPTLQSRDLTETWASQGCYTDMSTSRTLARASHVDTSGMTVESCLSFCSSGGFNFAGVEFGSECYCDYALQATGTPTSQGNCDLPCTGNATELCGAANFIDIYWNGALPIVPQTVGTWQYKGCFADNVASRALPHLETIPGGVTSESCTAACKANGLAVAGLEYGGECWCSSSLPTSSLLGDSDCHTACAANTTEFCGGSSKLTVYEDSVGEICLSTTRATSFNLQAVYFTPPTTGPASVPLHVIFVNTVTLVSWSILSAGSGTFTFTSEVLTNGGILPMSSTQPNFRTTSLAVVPGDSPTFVTTQFPPTAFPAYCIMPNPVLGSEGAQSLAVNGRNDLFALCPNSTASGRLDVVFNPVPNHPHYVEASCNSVYITLV
ncbi:WSC domain-containing protein [Mycena epipterygia]|nr:WSC domain-containing protein [Mycena epipterygia]